MPRPQGMDTRSRAFLFNPWAIVAAYAICAAVTLPAPGKCTYLSVRGFKVTVCR